MPQGRLQEPTEPPSGRRRTTGALALIGVLLLTGLAGCLESTNSSVGCGEGTTLVDGLCESLDSIGGGDPGSTVTFSAEARISGYIIGGATNPTLSVTPGDVVTFTVANTDVTSHDLAIEGLGVGTEMLRAGESGSFTFTVPGDVSTLTYYCTVPGHRSAGMVGAITVVGGSGGGPGAGPIGPAELTDIADISRNMTDLPPPVTRTNATTVHIELEAREVTAELEPGVTYTFWTFGGQVPGPMIRVLVNDTVMINMTNLPSSGQTHSIDLHAVNGPGGGADSTQVQPGNTHQFSFQARSPGVFIYHCATPHVPTHISNGMFGLISVEPEGGLPPVDHEFYLAQHELYTPWAPAEARAEGGHQTVDSQTMFDELPTYVLFNGAWGLPTADGLANHAEVGTNESVRVFFGVGGPNLISSFHIIGEIFDRAYYETYPGSGEPMLGAETIPVSPGQGIMVEFDTDVPADLKVVDHALSRVFDKGALAIIRVIGPEDPGVYDEISTA